MTLWLAVGICDAGVSLLVLLNGMTIFKYEFKYKEILSEELENEAKMLVCEHCKTEKIIPQHHGRDMLPSKKDDKLICWRKMLDSEGLEPCEEELPLFCPKCEKELKLK